MIPSLSISASGLNAASRTLETSAQNTANMKTGGYNPYRTGLEESSSGGVNTNVVRATAPLPAITDTHGRTYELSGTEPAAEAVNMMSARHMFSANADAVKTADEAAESILDIVA